MKFQTKATFYKYNDDNTVTLEYVDFKGVTSWVRCRLIKDALFKVVTFAESSVLDLVIAVTYERGRGAVLVIVDVLC